MCMASFLTKIINWLIQAKFFKKITLIKLLNLLKNGKSKSASKIIRPAINYLIKKKCKKIILGCTELPIAIFAFKSFKKLNHQKFF